MKCECEKPHRGSAACLNFADSVSRLRVPLSKDAKDLRKAAAATTEAFRLREGFAGKGAEEFSGVCEVSGVAGLAEAVLMSPPPLLGWRFSWDEVERDA